MPAARPNSGPSATRGVKGNLGKELAGFQRVSNFERIENCDETCLGVFFTCFCFFIILGGVSAKFWLKSLEPPPPLVAIEDFRRGLHREYGSSDWNETVHKAFDAMDPDHDGVIDSGSFGAGVKSFLNATESAWVFVQFDCNEEGLVSSEEFQMVLEDERGTWESGCPTTSTTTTTRSTTSSTSTQTRTTTSTRTTSTSTTTTVTTYIPQLVSGSFTIGGVDYEQLSSNRSLKEAFETKCKDLIAAQAGSSFSSEDIDVLLSRGSVSVRYTLPVPGDLAHAAHNNMAMSNFRVLLVQELAEIPGILDVASGDVVAEHLQASLVDDIPHNRIGKTTSTTTTMTTKTSTAEEVVIAPASTTSLHEAENSEHAGEASEPEESDEQGERGEESEEGADGEESEEGADGEEGEEGVEDEEDEEGEQEGDGQGQGWLAEYLRRLGETHTEVAAVAVRFRNSRLAEWPEARRQLIKEPTETYILRAIDHEGELESGISFTTLRRNLVANGRIKLSRGLTLHACEAALRDDEEDKQHLVERVNSHLGGNGSNFPALAAGDIDIDLFESTSDGFYRWDVNLNTALELSEFKLAADEMLGLHYTNQRAEEIFHHLDINSDNRLSADEFFVQSPNDLRQDVENADENVAVK